MIYTFSYRFVDEFLPIHTFWIIMLGVYTTFRIPLCSITLLIRYRTLS